MNRLGFQPNLRDDWRVEPVSPRRPDPTAGIQDLITYTYAMPPIETPDLLTVRRAIEEVQAFNAARPLGSRRLVALDAAPHHGKTTLIIAVALAQARAAWGRAKPSMSPPTLEWAYVNATSRGEGRSVAADLAAFCDLPKPSSRPTAAEYIVQLSHVARKIGLGSVIVDDVHSLRSDVRATGRTVADSIKGLVTTVPATFVLAGVDLRSHPLFADSGRGRVAAAQLVNRAEWIELKPWPSHDRHGDYNENWLELLARISNYLVLPKGAKQNRLNTRTAIDYLLQGCGGRPGTAIEWIQRSAVWAIQAGRNLDQNALAARKGRHQ